VRRLRRRIDATTRNFFLKGLPLHVHVDLYWTLPGFAEFAQALTAFSRLILFDKRGTGLSDPAIEVPTLDVRMEDLLAVLDAVGAQRVALFGLSEGAPLSILFAATHPDRTVALVLFGSAATMPLGRSVPWDDILDHWGEGRALDPFAPSLVLGRLGRRLASTFERAAASPAMARALTDSFAEGDVTDLLAGIRVPTLVLHRDGDRIVPVGVGRWLAERIPGARWVELHGDDHFPWVGD
jgi:pimeloyl-ACP methyl ester carboxylesterase